MRPAPSSGPTRCRATRASTAASTSSTIPSAEPRAAACVSSAAPGPRARSWTRRSPGSRASRRGPSSPGFTSSTPTRPTSRRGPTGSASGESPYDGEVAYADSQLATPAGAGWSRSGEAARTLVVVTSDHGEGLGDHGEDEHQLFVYDSTLRVPLVLSWPGRLPAGRRVAGQFRSVDLAADAPRAPGTARHAHERSEPGRGRCLGASPIPESESYAESLFGQLHFGWAPLRALRGQGWKYIDAPRAELYDLTEDPGETRNRIDDRGQVASAMRERLGGLGTGGRLPPRHPSIPRRPSASPRSATSGGPSSPGPPRGSTRRTRVGRVPGLPP